MIIKTLPPYRHDLVKLLVVAHHDDVRPAVPSDVLAGGGRVSEVHAPGEAPGHDGGHVADVVPGVGVAQHRHRVSGGQPQSDPGPGHSPHLLPVLGEAGVQVSAQARVIFPQGGATRDLVYDLADMAIMIMISVSTQLSLTPARCLDLYSSFV